MKTIEFNQNELEMVCRGLHTRIKQIKEEKKLYPSAGGMGNEYYEKQLKENYKILGKLATILEEIARD